MRNKCMVLLGIFLFLSFFLFGCGGGGGSSSPPPSIQALLLSFPTGSVPPGYFPNALVQVTDSSGAVITSATVVVNGVTLPYNASPTHQDYEGNVTVIPGGSVTLSVTVGGKTYTASGTQFTTYPTISSPMSGDTWLASNANTVTWLAGSPLTPTSVYLLGVLDAADPIGGTAYFQAEQTGINSFSIPPSSLTAGSRVVIVGITTPVLIPNAATDSAFVIGGFNYVPITVTAPIQLVPFAGLAGINDTSHLGALTANSALIDGNLTVSSGINIGQAPSLSGDFRQRNMGLDFGVQTTVSTIYVWVDRPLPPVVVNSFSWDIYTSPDNQNWFFAQTVFPAYFSQFANRFEISFSTVSARYVKVVTRPLAIAVIPPPGFDVSNIFITEVQAFTM